MNAAIPIAAVLTVSLQLLMRLRMLHDIRLREGQRAGRVTGPGQTCLSGGVLRLTPSLCDPADVRDARPHLRGRRPVSGRGLRLFVPLPHPGHAPLPAVQRGALHCQSSR